MNLRHVPSLKASKRGYQIIFVLPIIVLSSLFSTCSGCGDLPETLEFNYPEIVGTVNSPLGDIPPQWRGTPEPGTAYAIAPDLPEGLTLDPSTGIISGTAKVIVEVGQYTITATFPSGGTKSVKISLRTEGSIDTPPDAPSNVEAAAGVGTIAVTWEDPADTGILGGEKAQITGFKIYYSENQIDTAQDTPLGFSDLTKDRRVTITGLINGTAYSIAVAAVTEAGEGELSTPVTAVPKALLSITSYGENEIGLTWNGPADSIDEYRVYYAASTINDVDDAGVESETFTETSMTITGLTAGTRYYFKGTAFSGTGESTVSPEVDAYTNSLPGVPVNIQASTTGGGEITVSWDSPLPGYFAGSAASVSYKVYYHIGGLTETDLSSLTPEVVNTGRRHVLTNLQKDSSYFVTVIASNDLGDSAMPPSVGAASFGANRPPGAAASVTIDSSTETGISLSWTAPADTGLINDDGTPGIITAYRIYYSETQSFTIDGQTAMSEVGSTAEASIDNLNSGTPYYFKIAAANAVGWGNASDVVTGYTTGRAGAPANVSADPGTTADSEVTLTWDAPADRGIEDSGGTAGTITGYRVYYAASPINDVNGVGVTRIDAQGTSQKITSGLTTGTRYYFKVAAVNGIGEGTVSLEADTYTNSVPGEPSNILSVITGVGKSTVTWDEPSPGYYAGSAASVRYRVYYKTDNLVETDLPSLNPEDVDAGRIQVLTNLRIDRPYFITVIASNVLGDSAMPASVKTRQGWESRPPGVPTSVTIDSSPENGIELSWTPPFDTGIVAAKTGTIIGYEVYYSKAPIFAVNGEGINSQTTTVNSISFTTFDRGTRYYFKVTAANGIGSGNASNEVTSFTTAGPGAPTNVAADPGTRADSEVTLTWAAPVDKGVEDSSGTVGTIAGYEVYYAASTINDLTAAGLGTQTSTGTSMTITGLTAGTRYYFKVAAVTGIGEGTASLEADTYTNGVPGEPARIQAAATGAEELTITWDESSPGYYAGSETPISYRVYYKIGSLTEADLSSLNPEVVDAGKDLSQVLTNLQADSTYSVTVIAVNDVGSSAMPESIEAVPFGADRSPGAAASVTITSSTESEIELSWTAPTDTGIINGDGTQGIITAYTIYYSKTQGFIIDGNTAKKDVDNTTPTTTASIDSLNSGTQYYFKVIAENATGSGNASDEADGYTTSKPGAPTIVAADPGTAADNEVTLTWDAPGDTGIKDLSGAEDEITGYKVYYAESTITDLSGGGVTGVDAQGTPHKITGLTPGTQYYFRVTANNGKGEGTASLEADTYTNSLPGTPTGIQAVQGVESLTVSWDAPFAGYLEGNSGVLSYKVYHSTADITLSTDLTALTETEVTSGTTAALSSLTGGTPYYLIVIANNGYGDSTRPAAITDVPWEPNRVPGAPTSVTITSSTETGIDLSWTAPTDTGIINGDGTQGIITAYTIYYSETQGFIIDGNTAKKDVDNTTPTTTASIDSLNSGTQYYFKVTAANDTGSGNASTEGYGYTTGRPGAPTAVAADPGTTADNEVTLTWDAPVDTGIAASGGKPGSITEYKVYYAASAINDLTAAGVESETSTGTGTSMTITGLTAGTRYYFKVTAVSAIGEGTASAEVNTYTNSLPGVPTNIQANSKSVGEITVTWDAPSPGYYDGSEASVSYKVYHKIDNLAKADLLSLTPATVDTDLSHVLTGLQAGITYYVTVIAVNDFGDSAMPTSVEADRTPGEPTSVTITSSTETGIELSWTAPGDTGIEGGSGAKGRIMGYEVYYSKTANFAIDDQGVKSQTLGNTTSISLSSLDSGTRYYFKVTAANAAGSGNPSAEIGGYTTSRPGAPTAVAANPGTTADNEVTLTWDAPDDTGIADSGGKPGSITEYKVYYAASTINDLNAAVEWPQSATGTSMTITGLSAGNRYYFKVTAVNGIGEGTTSSEADTYTNSLPGVPSNIQATQGIESLTVSWTAPSAGFSGGSSGVLSYKVYHSTADITSGTDLTALTETDASSGTTAALSSLTGGTPYYLIVIANNGFGDSTRPAAITAVPWEPNRVPGAPTSVTITSSTETGIDLSWTAPTDTGIINGDGTQGIITAYTIYYSETQGFIIDGNTAKKDVDNTTPTTTASIDSLNSGTQYYFKVTAANDTGSGNASTEGYGYTTGRPGAPTAVAADPGTTADNEVTLTWDVPYDTGIADSDGKPGSITGYKVYYAASTINDLTAAGVESETSTGTGTSKTITGLTAGTRYYFKVTAVSAIGEGTASAEANTYTNSLPGVPTNIQANSTGVGEITVTWDAPSPGYYDGSAASVSYKVYHKIDNLAEADLLSLTPATVDTDLSHVLTGLQAGITYYVTVIAVNDFGDSAMPTSVEADRTPGEPTSVTITSSTETGIELSWTAPGDTGIEGGSGAKGTIMGYEVYYSKTAGFTIGAEVGSKTTGNTTSISLSSLDSGTRYYFKVTAANDSGSGNPSAEIGGYTTSRPGAPTAVAANPGTTADNEVTLTWDAPDDTGIADSGGKPGSITEYKVYYAASTINDLNAAVEWPQSATGTSMTITGLSAGNRYYFKVTAVNGIGEGTTSSEADTYTNSLPGVPSNIQATQGIESLTVSWTAPSAGFSGGSSGVLSYKVYHSTADITSGTDLTALTETDASSGTTAALSSLTGGTPYYLIVIANNGFGDSTRPAAITAVPWEPNRGPGAPTSVKITSSTETGIELSWTAPGDTGIEGGSGAKGRIMGYEVYYSKTANFAIDDQGVKSQTLGNTTSISLSSLDSGTRYYFKVTAANDSGSGNPSEEADGYTTSRPGAPTDVAANPGTTANNEVTLTWDAPGDTGIKDSTGMADTIIGYRVYHAASPITDVGGVTGVNAQGESHKITGLTPGTRYYFKVTAVSAIGEGTASAEVNTYTNSLPGVPTNIQANSTGVGEITVTWDAPSPGYYDGSAASVSYKVYYKIDNLAEADLLSLTPATVDTGRSYVLTGLQGGSTYFVTVIAVNDFGDSAMPTSVEANRPPGAPTSVNITSSTETGIKLSWIPPTDVGIINGDGTQGTILGYEVHYSKTPNFAIDDQGVKSQTLGDAISFSLSSLESGTRYYLRVTAANESGSGAASAEADGYTTSRPDAPTNVSPLPAADTDATEIEVTWEAPVGTGIKDIGGTADNITGYRLYYAASPITDVNGAGVTGVDVQGTSKKITSGLAVGTQYYFKVTAVNEIGEGAASSEVYTYTDGPPGQPENVAASPNGIWGTSATVRWAHPTNSGYYGGQPLAHPAKYRVYWAESTGTIERDRGNYTDVGGDQTSLVIGGDHSDNDVPHAGSLMPDAEYKFAVEAFSFDDSRSKRRSPRSNEDSFTPFQLAPDGPTNLRSIQADKEGRAVFLEWDPPAYTGRYNDGTEAPLEDISYTIAAMPVGAGVDSLSAAAEKGAASILISQAAGTLASDKDFVPGVEYGFQVTSRLEKEGIGDGRGSSYKSDTWQAPITLRAGSPVHTQSYIGGMTVDGAEQPRFGSSDGALAISPDGKSLYLAATEAETVDYFEGGTLLVFDRDEDGTITLREEHPHIQSRNNDDGLRRPRDVVVSPDGKNVYLVADGNIVNFLIEYAAPATLVVFSRDDDGSLNKTQVLRNNRGGVKGIGDASALAISPGGETIYVAGPEDNSLAIFDRNTTTGALAYSNMVQSADDLTEVEDVAVSADGEKVYAVGPGSLAIFDRDSSGSLTSRGVLKQGVSGVGGLEEPTGVAVSSDGQNVYVSDNTDGVTTFRRNASGGLTYVGTLPNADSRDLVVSPDGRYVYVPTNDEFEVYERDIDGSLTSDVNFGVTVPGANSCNAVVISPDNKNIYVFTNTSVLQDEHGTDIDAKGLLLTFLRFDIY